MVRIVFVNGKALLPQGDQRDQGEQDHDAGGQEQKQPVSPDKLQSGSNRVPRLSFVFMMNGFSREQAAQKQAYYQDAQKTALSDKLEERTGL